MKHDEIEIREVSTIEGFGECARLQREVFALPDLEVSPVRHLVVTRSAGGFTLGAFAGKKLAGFVLSVPMFNAEKRAFYSHMTAVSKDFQNHNIGARLKWAQREMALQENIDFIKWTFQPAQARNAYFNLEKLGAVIKEYQPNFYGTDYGISAQSGEKIGLDSDRLYAEWHLKSEKVKRLANGENFIEPNDAVKTIEIPADWNALLENDLPKAVAEQTGIKREFQAAFAENLICRSFEKSETRPKYLLYKN